MWQSMYLTGFHNTCKPHGDRGNRVTPVGTSGWLQLLFLAGEDDFWPV